MAKAENCPHHSHGPTAPVPRTVCDAGHPFWVKPHAKLTDETHHHGYYVGGGGAHGGRGPCPQEGTFGWDYSGLAKVRLNWTRGRYQMGGGTYTTTVKKPVEALLDHFHGED